MNQKDKYIYPSIIKKILKINDKKVYEILMLLENAHIVKMYYEVFCDRCHDSKGLYTYFNELNDDFICDHCKQKLNSLRNIKIVYY